MIKTLIFIFLVCLFSCVPNDDNKAQLVTSEFDPNWTTELPFKIYKTSGFSDDGKLTPVPMKIHVDVDLSDEQYHEFLGYEYKKILQMLEDTTSDYMTNLILCDLYDTSPYSLFHFSKEEWRNEQKETDIIEWASFLVSVNHPSLLPEPRSSQNPTDN